MYLVDSHCHLDALAYPEIHRDPADALAKARAAGVTHVLAPGVDLASFPRLYEMTKDLPGVWCACAVHPENLTESNRDWDENLMRAYLSRDRVAALGETGLDYVNAPETKDLQLESFARQIRLAAELKKPLIVHSRGAGDDCLALLRSEGGREAGGVMHCFCESREVARRALDLGFYLSFSGIVTFKNAENVRDACRYAPLERILVETDAPYLAPVPKRGKPNEPAYVAYTARAAAALKGVPYEEFCDLTARNFAACFRVSLD